MGAALTVTPRGCYEWGWSRGQIGAKQVQLASSLSGGELFILLYCLEAADLLLVIVTVDRTVKEIYIAHAVIVYLW